MAQVRSKELGAAVISAGTAFTTLYTCPSGKTALWKSLLINTGATPGGTAYAGVERPSGDRYFFLRELVVAAPNYLYFDLWVALEPGDKIIARALDQELRYYCSGAELDGVSA